MLVKIKTSPPVPAVTRDDTELEKVANYALLLTERLEHTRDFRPVVQKFFAADYINGYLRDRNTNWFFNLDRETAAKASRAELQRFYVALLNSAYLSGVYLLSQYTDTEDGSVAEEKLPPDVVAFIAKHPYTAKYQSSQDNNNYLAETIDSIDRLRSYTNLLEGIADLMRKHVVAVGAERSPQYRTILEDEGLYQPKVRICSSKCLGLPRGTRIFEVNVPVFQLQLAEIKGELKVISVIDSFH